MSASIPGPGWQNSTSMFLRLICFFSPEACAFPLIDAPTLYLYPFFLCGGNVTSGDHKVDW